MNIFQLASELNSWPELNFLSSNIWCPVDKNESPIADVDSKFYVSPAEFPNGKFPDHCCGLGYITTIGVIDRIVNEISKWFLGTVCSHEDVFMTGIVPSRINAMETSSFWRKVEPIELVDRKLRWVSLALEDGRGDEDYFLRSLIRHMPYVSDQYLKEFRKRYDSRIFYLLSHSIDFGERFLRLWHAIKISFSN